VAPSLFRVPPRRSLPASDSVVPALTLIWLVEASLVRPRTLTVEPPPTLRMPSLTKALPVLAVTETLVSRLRVLPG
jgi:hypothetical protein